MFIPSPRFNFDLREHERNSHNHRMRECASFENRDKVRQPGAKMRQPPK